MNKSFINTRSGQLFPWYVFLVLSRACSKREGLNTIFVQISPPVSLYYFRFLEGFNLKTTHCFYGFRKFSPTHSSYFIPLPTIRHGGVFLREIFAISKLRSCKSWESLVGLTKNFDCKVKMKLFLGIFNLL